MHTVLVWEVSENTTGTCQCNIILKASYSSPDPIFIQSAILDCPTEWKIPERRRGGGGLPWEDILTPEPGSWASLDLPYLA